VTLELGGKSPAIVFADADMELAVESVNFGLFFNAGQCCCASSRVFVHADVYDDFCRRWVERAAKITVGPGLTSPGQGPQVDQDSVEKIDRLVKSGKVQGAKCVLGGERPAGAGFFYPPTIFVDVKDDMTIAREEIFGPVASVIKFSSVEEVITRANDSLFGLAGAVFTKDLNLATTVALGLRAGTVWVNCYDVLEASMPFGGYKESGTVR
jgi:aldehyde dehydrogenase (NAD+)